MYIKTVSKVKVCRRIVLDILIDFMLPKGLEPDSDFGKIQFKLFSKKFYITEKGLIWVKYSYNHITN